MTAASYDASGQDIADYQGQVVNSAVSDPGYSTPGNVPTWTFSNLSPNNAALASGLCYDLYVYSATTPTGPSFTFTGGTHATSDDPAHPGLDSGWHFWGSITLSLDKLVVTYSSGTDPTAVCLLRQTSATAYDADGEVTAAIDPLGRVSASAYDASGQDIADYQGQVGGNPVSSTWSFGNLSPGNVAPASAPSYDVYAYYANPAQADPNNTHYQVHDEQETLVDFLSINDPTAPALGAGWYLLGTVGGLATSTSGLTVAYDNYSTAPSDICLMQQTSAIAYDAGGQVTAATDPMGASRPRPTTPRDRSSPITGARSTTARPAARRLGPSITSPNNQSSYDVYGYSATASLNNTVLDVNNTAIGTPDDPTAPSLGAGWYLLGTVTASGSTLDLDLRQRHNTRRRLPPRANLGRSLRRRRRSHCHDRRAGPRLGLDLRLPRAGRGRLPGPASTTARPAARRLGPSITSHQQPVVLRCLWLLGHGVSEQHRP